MEGEIVDEEEEIKSDDENKKDSGDFTISYWLINNKAKLSYLFFLYKKFYLIYKLNI